MSLIDYISSRTAWSRAYGSEIDFPDTGVGAAARHDIVEHVNDLLASGRLDQWDTLDECARIDVALDVVRDAVGRPDLYSERLGEYGVWALFADLQVWRLGGGPAGGLGGKQTVDAAKAVVDMLSAFAEACCTLATEP